MERVQIVRRYVQTLIHPREKRGTIFDASKFLYINSFLKRNSKLFIIIASKSIYNITRARNMNFLPVTFRLSREHIWGTFLRQSRINPNPVNMRKNTGRLFGVIMLVINERARIIISKLDFFVRSRLYEKVLTCQLWSDNQTPVPRNDNNWISRILNIIFQQ